MSESFDLPDDVYEHVAEALLSKSWDEVNVLAQEATGRLMFPGQLRKRLANGKFETKDVCLQVPRPQEMRDAKRRSREWAENEKMDPRYDATEIRDLEIMCILWHAIRNTTPPHEPMYMDPQELEKYWDKSSLVQVWRRVEALTRIIDPAPDSMSDAELLAVVAKMAKDQSMAPLAEYGSGAQASCVISMASMLTMYLASQSSPG